MILDFHTHLGDIFPKYQGIQISEPSPPPHYLMISSPSIEAPHRLFYRERPFPWSCSFIKHAIITLWRRKRTYQGMVIPNLLRDMKRYHITRSVVLPIEYHDGIERSKELIQACRHIPELVPFCSVHPRDPLSISKVRMYMQMGAHGLKLHPTFQHLQLDDTTLFPLYEEYETYRRPLILHSGLTGREGRFGSGRRSFSSIERMESIFQNFPKIPVILAHAGIAQYELAMTLAQKYGNVYLELSGQPAQHIAQVLSMLGAERLLFGTDWPFWNQSFALQAVRQAVKGDHAAARCILHDNAARLLHGLPEP